MKARSMKATPFLASIDWAMAGATLANADSEDQIAFFKAFVNECNSWGTRLQGEKQLSFINAGLTTQEREDLSMITYIADSE